MRNESQTSLKMYTQNTQTTLRSRQKKSVDNGLDSYDQSLHYEKKSKV